MLILMGGGLVRAADEDEEARQRHAKATLEVARAGLAKELGVFRVRELCWWSQRILYAELELCGTDKDRLTAFHDHVKRCREFEGRILELREKQEIPITDMMDAKFFRSRAEFWLADEKVKQKNKGKESKDRKLPSPRPPADN
jgi:hypothetical protein